MFYDAHLHNTGRERGGFLIGLEGEPEFGGTLTNSEVLEKHSPDQKYVAFYYVSKNEIGKELDFYYLKYHPRREKYGVGEIIDSITKNKPKCVIIDTLNEPFLSSYDYWFITRKFPETMFVLAHAGGYLINDFIKICDFQKNVWLDFALTSDKFLSRSEKYELSYVRNAIIYALNSSFKERILFGSDYPFFSQVSCIRLYGSLNRLELLNNNYLRLLRMII